MQKWGFFSLPFLLPIANHANLVPRVFSLSNMAAGGAILESEKTLGTRLKVFQRMRSFWSAPRITKMAARALHRVCCSACYCQVSRHVSSLFRLQMTNTSVKHNKGFQLFYRGFFVSKGSWRSLHGLKNKQRGYKLMWQHHEYKFKKINTPTLKLALLLTMEYI